MTKVFEQKTLASGSGNQALLSDRQQLYNLEASQPEGTQMELLLTVAPAAGSVISALDKINQAAKSHGVLTWPGESDIAFATGTNQVALRWRRGQPWVLIVIGILVVAGVIIWYYLEGWRMQKGEFVNVYTGQKETPSQFLSTQVPAAITNPAAWLVAGVMVVGGLWIWHKAQLETSVEVRSMRKKVRSGQVRGRAARIQQQYQQDHDIELKRQKQAAREEQARREMSWREEQARREMQLQEERARRQAQMQGERARRQAQLED